jgi:sigma-B regulation protein RsbU (phosphoserine phosphatase)
MSTSSHSGISSIFPIAIFVTGNDQQTVSLNHTPYTVGRKVDRDLVIADPRVSREHATIVSENGEFFVVDLNSKHGTFVNGEKVDRHKLQRNDRLEFGARDIAYLIFHPLQHTTSNTAREFLSQISGIQIAPEASDLEKLTLFMEAARKLNTIGVLDEILVTLLDATLKLTRAERAYIFLRDLGATTLTLAAGRNSKGEPLLDDKTISRSVLDGALTSDSEYIFTDTSQMLDVKERKSIVTFDLRTVICMPLRKPMVQTSRSEQPVAGGEVMGALYVDSRFASRDITSVSHDILRAIASEAAQLVENARLVQAEEAGRRYQQELSIAASIQQRLLAVTLPEVPFARVNGRNLSCKEIGGDFFEAVNTPQGLAVVLADVSGKGVSAALLASILQGMVYSQLISGMPLVEIVDAVNRFFTYKHIGEKYATMIITRLRSDGDLEYVNCGHVPPVWICGNEVLRPGHGNLPVGLLADATYSSDRCQLKAGDRLILVTDGVTEAENARGDMFDSERLETVAGKSKSMEDVFAAVADFCGGTPLNDDCTVVELFYNGH